MYLVAYPTAASDCLMEMKGMPEIAPGMVSPPKRALQPRVPPLPSSSIPATGRTP